MAPPALCVDAHDRPRMLAGADVLTERGYTDAAHALRAATGSTEMGTWYAALRELRAVPWPVLRKAGLTADAVQANA